MAGTNGLKQCLKCKRDLPLDAFGKDKTKNDGLRMYCKECVSKNTQEKYNTSKLITVRKLLDMLKPYRTNVKVK